jgi:hypothetical protein
MSLYTEYDHYATPIGPDGSPYEYFEALRDEAIATRTPIGWSEKYGGYWVCTGMEEGREITRDTDAFSSIDVTFPAYSTPGARPLMLVGLDPPLHTKLRKMIQPPFSPRAAMAMSEYFRKDTNYLIDEFIDNGRVDVVEALTQAVPGRFTAMILGLPPEKGDLYLGWVHHIAAPPTDEAAGVTDRMQAVAEGQSAVKAIDAEIDAHFQELLSARRANPGDDVLSHIVHSRMDEGVLTDEEIKDFFIVLLIAGIGTTMFLLSTMIWRLGWDLELRRRLVAHPELLDTAVDEFLRFYPSAAYGRLVTKPVTVAGVRFEPGQHVVLSTPIMNRDPRAFPSPDVFDPQRSPNRHIGLGLGIHRCLGAHLVQVEAQAVCEEFLRRIPDYELDPGADSLWLTAQVGGMASVPLVFPAGGGSRPRLAFPGTAGG